jgi:hypothetical protein
MAYQQAAFPAYSEMFSTTVTVKPPGLTVTWSFSVTRLAEATVIVTLPPDASDPDAGEMDRPDGPEMV